MKKLKIEDWLIFTAIIAPIISIIYLYISDLIFFNQYGRHIDGLAGILIHLSIIFVSVPLIIIALLIYFIRKFKSRKTKNL